MDTATLSFPPAPVTPAGWARLLRVHQWSKNLLAYLPLATGHAYGDVPAVAACTLAFLALSLIASGTYLLNDVVDAGADAAHPTKRHRLVASGRVSKPAALAAAVALATAGLCMAACATPAFALMAVAYLLGSVAYSLAVKRVAMADVVAVAMLFTLRVAAGAEVARMPQSPWLLSFSTLFFLSLAFAKRHAEVHAAHLSGRRVAGRGYRGEDWPLTLAAGLGALFAALVVLAIFLSEAARVAGDYASPGLLWATPLLVGTWALRIWLLAHRGELEGDPVSFALRDPNSLAMGALVIASYALASA